MAVGGGPGKVVLYEIHEIGEPSLVRSSRVTFWARPWQTRSASRFSPRGRHVTVSSVRRARDGQALRNYTDRLRAAGLVRGCHTLPDRWPTRQAGERRGGWLYEA